MKDELIALAERVKELTAERDFLLARAGHAGCAMFGGERWTGMSSNALVTIAFGGEDEALPFDGNDLAACYRTVLRLPSHLHVDAVFQQLERGEAFVSDRHPEGVAWARKSTGWPAAAALRTAMEAGE